MKIKNLALAATIVTAALSSLVAPATAYAQSAERRAPSSLFRCWFTVPDSLRCWGFPGPTARPTT
jgi:hypothetical protein